jgi:ATP-dependent RNA helicase DeaD
MTISSTERAAPSTGFEFSQLSPPIRRAVSEAGYLRPTSVQSATFKLVSTGRDVIVQSKTGSGKTAAFALPLIDQRIDPANGVQVMVLCPTRELALQVSGEVSRLSKYSNIRAVAIYGGASLEKQVDEINAGAQFVVGTPGRVLDHLKRGTLNVKNLFTVCLDEADEMLSMGFAEELNAIMERLPKPRQTLLFSATMPESIRRLAVKHQRDPESILLSSDQIAPESIDHFIYYIGAQDRVSALGRILAIEQPERAIIFCNTRDETQSVAHSLQKQGVAVDYISGELEQGARERVLAAFREGKTRHLVATDVAARGIDVSSVTHVVNFGFPQEAESYVHRTGRTGRAGRRGVAISLFGPADVGSVYMLRLTYGIRPIERALPSAAEERTRREVEQLEHLRASAKKSPVDQAARDLTRRMLSHDDAEVMISSLVARYMRETTEAALDKQVVAVAPRSAVTNEAVPPTQSLAVDAAPKTPEPAATPVAKRRDDVERPRRIAVRGGDDPGVESETVDSDLEDVRVAVGRRDGARGGELIRMLRDLANVGKRDVGNIKVYEQFTIIPLRATVVDQVIEALQDSTLNDRPLLPERGSLTADDDQS